MKKNKIWPRISPRARQNIALTAVAFVFVVGLAFDPRVPNFVGALFVAVGGLFAAWSKVKPEYIYAAQQQIKAGDFDVPVGKPSEDDQKEAIRVLAAREQNGLAMVAVGGAAVAAAALRSFW